ncbi:hypothetical protein BGZ70_007060, partial [Mortierella alpina]
MMHPIDACGIGSALAAAKRAVIQAPLAVKNTTRVFSVCSRSLDQQKREVNTLESLLSQSQHVQVEKDDDSTIPEP